MALIAETGSGDNLAADTYATVDELRAYATKRGETVPVSDADCEPLLIKAMDWLEAQELRFLGQRVHAAQPLAWPRSGVRRPNGWDYYPPDVIPPQLKLAQCALAVASQEVDLQLDRVPGDTAAVTSEKVGPITVTYAEPTTRITQPTFATAEGFLVTLVRGGSGAMGLVRA